MEHEINVIMMAVQKSWQVLVQARMGKKISTKSIPVDDAQQWFDVNIEDNLDVFQEIKYVYPDPAFVPGQSLSCEFSIKTADDNEMILETWCFKMLPPDANRKHVNIMDKAYQTALHTQGSTLLKCLITTNKATPAFALSRNQSPGTYIMTYETYLGIPDVEKFGEKYKHEFISQLCTSLGTLRVEVFYRTNTVISTKGPINVKDDHYNTELKARQIFGNGFSDGSRSNSPRDIPGMYGMLEGSTGLRPSTSNDSFGRGSYTPSPRHSQNSTPQKHAMLRKSPEPSGLPRVGAFGDLHAAFAPSSVSSKGSDDVPFSVLLNNSSDDEDSSEASGLTNGKSKSEKYPNKTSSEQQSKKDAHTPPPSLNSNNANVQDDFVMVDVVNAAFGDVNNDTSDLGAFFREVQGAPTLSMFQQEPSIEEALSGISEQLQHLEATTTGIDEFIESLDSPNGDDD